MESDFKVSFNEDFLIFVSLSENHPNRKGMKDEQSAYKPSDDSATMFSTTLGDVQRSSQILCFCAHVLTSNKLRSYFTGIFGS